MPDAINQSQINVPVRLGLVERVILGIPAIIPCCIFFIINLTMLFTLRTKRVFCETSRYILLYNLLFADTLQMAVSQIMYILYICRILLTYPVCGVLVMLANLTNEISPLTLVVMSLERFVAVCYPLRHATIITIRNTGVAILLVWAFCSLNVLVRVILLLDFPFQELDNLQMDNFCTTDIIYFVPVSAQYAKAYTIFLFISSTLAVISTYVGVIIAARSASTDKASASKARNTLLLHMVQLGFSLLSTLHNSLALAISTIVTRVVFLRILTVMYVLIIIFPRCLSVLIYGLRDQTIRPVLLYYLCCRLKLSFNSTKAEVSS